MTTLFGLSIDPILNRDRSASSASRTPSPTKISAMEPPPVPTKALEKAQPSPIPISTPTPSSTSSLFERSPSRARLTEEYLGLIETSTVVVAAIDEAMKDWE